MIKETAANKTIAAAAAIALLAAGGEYDWDKNQSNSELTLITPVSLLQKRIFSCFQRESPATLAAGNYAHFVPMGLI